MSHEPNFYEQVYAVARAIPRGKVLNYGALAALLGRPRGARAVGYALNNPAPGTDVPWQRIVGKRGIFGVSTIRSFAHAREEQVELLKAEGIQFDDQNQLILADYLWTPSPVEIAEILNDGS